MARCAALVAVVVAVLGPGACWFHQYHCIRLDAAGPNRFPKKFDETRLPGDSPVSRNPGRSRARRHLIEKSRDSLDAPVLQHGEIGALDRAVGAVRAEPPGEADVVAEPVGLADQLELEVRKFLLHACYQRLDAVMAVARHP